MTSPRPHRGSGLSVRHALILYLALAGAGHLLWETAQLSLYTIWWTGTLHQILFALIHCSAGDLLITSAALGLAALIARVGGRALFGGVMILTAILLGLGYAVFSEWLNANIRHSWSYTASMPVLPPLGTGLTPFLQWLIVPGLTLGYVAFRFAGNPRRRRELSTTSCRGGSQGDRAYRRRDRRLNGGRARRRLGR